MFKRLLLMTTLCLVALFGASSVFAAGTPASFDRDIANTVTATYNDVNANAMTPVSQTVHVSVHYVYGVTLSSPATLLSNYKATVHYMISVTNNGNAPDSFLMTNAKSGAGWDASSVTFYRDNGSGVETSTVLASATSDMLAAGGSQNIWVDIVIPSGTGPSSNAELVTATSTTNVWNQAHTLAVSPVYDTTTLTTTTDTANFSTATKTVDQVSLHYKANQSITYSIHLVNTGTVAATNVVVTDTISSDIDTAAFSSTDGTLSGSVFTSTPITVPASSTVTISFAAKIRNESPGIVDATTIANVAHIAFKSGTDTDPETPFNTPAVTVTVDAPKLAVTKTADVASALPGTPINYHVTVTNNGHDVANAVVIADTLSGFVTFGKILHASDGAGADSVAFIDPSNCAPSYSAGVVSGNVTGSSLAAAGGKAEFFYRVTVNKN